MLRPAMKIAASALAIGAILCLAACGGGPDRNVDNSNHDYGRDDAVMKGVAYLLRNQHNSNWESDIAPTRGGPQVGGASALALFALESARSVTNDQRLLPESPELASAFAWLRRTRTTMVYPTSLKIMALLATGEAEDAALAKDLGQKLLDGMKPGGGYSYKIDGGELQFDSSNSDYGQAGVMSATRAGLTVPREYDATMQRFWKTQQNPDGGWGYAPPSIRPNSTSGLTGGAVASMLELGIPPTDPSVANGLTFLNKNFSATVTDYYALFNVARAASAAHEKTLGGVDWREMLRYELIRLQSPDGSWYAETDTFWGKPNPAICTSYALLFLSQRH
jgi:hypothetical protein